MKKKLERFMYMGLGAVIALGGYFFGTFHSDQVDAQVDTDNIVTCRGLIVEDEDGKTRIALGTNPEDENGIIGIFDKNGKPRVALQILSDGTGEIYLGDENGKSRVNLHVDNDGRGLIGIQDENQKFLVSLALDTNKGMLTFLDKNRKARTTIGTLPDERGAISIFDENMKPIIILRGDTDGKAFIGIADENGNIVRVLD